MMTNRIGPIVCAFALALLALGVAPLARQADQKMNDFKPFSTEAFKAAKATGKPVLVFFHAPWCPVCRAQEPKLKALLNSAYAHVIPLTVDYDSNVALRREMNVQKQSTVILYQGDQELARISYTSEDAAINGLFAHAKMNPGMSGR